MTAMSSCRVRQALIVAGVLLGVFEGSSLRTFGDRSLYVTTEGGQVRYVWESPSGMLVRELDIAGSVYIAIPASAADVAAYHKFTLG